MSSSSVNPVTGAPVFLDADAPDPAVNPTEVAAFAAKVGTRSIGSTAERNAFAYARLGFSWFDTDLKAVFEHNGTGWVLTDEPWRTATLMSNNTNISSLAPTRYRIQRKTVFVEGGIVATGSAGYAIFQLPTGYRPAVEVSIYADNGSRIQITTDGTVNSTILGAKTVRFNGFFGVS